MSNATPRPKAPAQSLTELPARRQPVWSRPLGGKGCSKEVSMTEEEKKELSSEELEEQNADQLPDREVMSLINPGVDGIPTIAPFEPEGN
jgi:hypothetical protein